MESAVLNPSLRTAISVNHGRPFSVMGGSNAFQNTPHFLISLVSLSLLLDHFKCLDGSARAWKTASGIDSHVHAESISAVSSGGSSISPILSTSSYDWTDSRYLESNSLQPSASTPPSVAFPISNLLERSTVFIASVPVFPTIVQTPLLSRAFLTMQASDPFHSTLNSMGSEWRGILV
jgi:hypothetical protein